MYFQLLRTWVPLCALWILCSMYWYTAHALSPCWQNQVTHHHETSDNLDKEETQQVFQDERHYKMHPPPRKKKVAECHLSIIKPGNWKSGEWCFPKENHLLHGIVCPNYQKKKVREENHIFSNMTCKVSEKGTALCSQEAAKGCAPPKPGRNPGEQDVRLREQGLQPQRQSMGVTKVTIKENSR